MRVRTFIVLLLCLIAAVFVGVIALLHTFDTHRVHQIAEGRERDWSRAVTDSLGVQSRTLVTMVNHYAGMDGLVSAIADGDGQWLAQHLTGEALSAYDANALWVYGPGGELVFKVSNIDPAEDRGIPVPPAELSRLFAQGAAAHFYLEVSGAGESGGRRFMEVRGTSVHPAWDSDQRTESQGFLLIGRLWDAERLSQFGRMTGNTVKVVFPGKVDFAPGGPGEMTFVQPWHDAAGVPVALLTVTRSAPELEELEGQNQRVLYSLTGVAILVILLVGVLLMRLVNRPLRQISRSLTTKDLAALQKLDISQSEFGELARLISRFFEQRESLIREMKERIVTEHALRESEERLRHSQKLEALGRLAGGVAHDFNNLLTAIIGYADLLGRGGGEKVPDREHAQLILEAGERAAALTRQLLAFSRKQVLEFRVIDVNDLVRSIEKLLQRIIGEHIEVVTWLEADEARIRADQNQVEQILLNLGVNARDAMPRGGRVTISTSNEDLEDPGTLDVPPGRYVVLTVSDTGSGMDPETASRVFEPFFTTKGPGKGTGLGLSTVYGIVRQTGGGIAVESEKGKGTTFRAYLPVVDAPVEERPVAGAVKGGPRGATIMIVEDEEVVRELMYAVLREEGYRLVCAASGPEAIEQAETTRFEIDLLVTDVIMPQMNGPAVAQEFRARYPSMQVLYVSGYSSADMCDQGVIDEELEVLEKPFTPGALRRRVGELLERARRATGVER